MFRQLAAFARLSRPHFLAGGVILYALGALMAWRTGGKIHWPIYALGQLVVTAVQLMTHYVNEYWDVGTDGLNQNRTWFSGGSGVFVGSRIGLPRSVARLAALASLFVGILAMLGISLSVQIGSSAWAIFLLVLGTTWFYSSPPVALITTGFGELAAALVVSFLVPNFSYLLQAAPWRITLITATAPLVLLCWSMIVVFEFPDYAADAAAGKQTLLVRLGHRRTRILIAATNLVAFGLLLVLPPQTGWPLLALPLAASLNALLPTDRYWSALTFNAIALFGLAALLQTFGLFIKP